jgi:hypothetical protein
VKRNKVSPTGEIVAIDQRGTFMGNRGRLSRGGEVVRPWDGRRWITCALSYKGWRAPAYGTDGRWTPLFFLDEAVALAAGHRPCALCRRRDFDRFVDAWVSAHGGPRPRVDAIDRVLHADRLDGRVQRRHPRPWSALPDTTFVLLDDGRPALVDADALVPWTVDGYVEPVARPADGDATVLTPSCTVDVLAAGYRATATPRSSGT